MFYSRLIGLLNNAISSSKNSTKPFNDGSLCWLLHSMTNFPFYLSGIPFGNFETKIHRVSGVYISFHSVAVPRLLHLFKKAKKIFGMTLHPHIVLVFPFFCKMHIFCVDLHAAFLVISLQFDIQDVLVVEHKA